MTVSKIFNNVPVLTGSGAYSSGNSIGPFQKISNFFRNNGDAVKIKSMILTDAAKQSSHLAVVFFNAAPAATVDQTAFAPLAADLAKIIGVLDVPAANYSAFSTTSGVDLIPVGAALTLKGLTKDLWYQIVAYGTPTYTAATSLNVRVTADYE